MTEPQQPKAAQPPTNTIDNIDEIIETFVAEYSREHDAIERLKDAINKTIMECLPEKKQLVIIGTSTEYNQLNECLKMVYNQAISDMEQALTKKYGRADNEGA